MEDVNGFKALRRGEKCPKEAIVAASYLGNIPQTRFRKYSRQATKNKTTNPQKSSTTKKTSTKGAVLPPTFGEIKGSGYAITHFHDGFRGDNGCCGQL